MLDEWLGSKPVLRELSYVCFYRKNDDLIGHLLRPVRPLTSAEVSDWYKAALEQTLEPPDGWHWNEVLTAILKYRNGLSESKISQSTGLAMTCVEGALEKCRSRLPFADEAKALGRSLRSGHAPINPLKEPGTWKRLVFQFSVANELPQRHILECLGPPAAISGYSITAGMLNVWLSNGRLLAQLATYLSKRSADRGT